MAGLSLCGPFAGVLLLMYILWGVIGRRDRRGERGWQRIA